MQALRQPHDAMAPGFQQGVRGDAVLAVIPTLNEERYIETCIRTLMQGDVRLADVDIVVADGGSTDRTREIVQSLTTEFPRLRLLENPKRLQAAAINLAASTCREGKQILVRCDAHSIYPNNFIMRVADALAARGVASLVIPMDAVGDTCFQRANAFIVDTKLGSGGSAHRGGRRSGQVDHGHHAGFDLARFLDVGGYDETFSHNEDAEYDRRVAKSGGVIWLDADIRIAYKPRGTVGGLARQYFSYGKGRVRNLLKHGDWPKMRQMIPQAVLLACVFGVALAPLSLWTLALPAAYLATLTAASIAIALLKGSLCGLMAGLASATMHMSWAAGFFVQFVREMLKPSV